MKIYISKNLNNLVYFVSLLYLILLILFTISSSGYEIYLNKNIQIVSTLTHALIPIILSAYILALINVEDIIVKFRPLEFKSEFKIFIFIQFVWHIIIWIDIQNNFKTFDLSNLSVQRSVIINLPILIWVFRTIVMKVYK